MPASGHVPKVIIVKKSPRARPKAVVFNMSLSQDLGAPLQAIRFRNMCRWRVLWQWLRRCRKSGTGRLINRNCVLFDMRSSTPPSPSHQLLPMSWVLPRSPQPPRSCPRHQSCLATPRAARVPFCKLISLSTSETVRLSVRSRKRWRPTPRALTLILTSPLGDWSLETSKSNDRPARKSRYFPARQECPGLFLSTRVHGVFAFWQRHPELAVRRDYATDIARLGVTGMNSMGPSA